MTSRIDVRALGERQYQPSSTTSSTAGGEGERVPAGGARPVVPVRPKVTAGVIDEAVENVLQRLDYNESVKRHFRSLLAADMEAGFAEGFYADNAAEMRTAVRADTDKPQLTIRHALPQDKISKLVSYGYDYQLRFLDEQSHDHAVGAACRQIDRAVLYSRLPEKVPFKDIGGDPLWYIERGIKHAHVCNPAVDPKDTSRHLLRKMRARQIWRDVNRDVAVRSMAERYLKGDDSFVCGKQGQECKYRAPFTISSHVYDIPMQDWPAVMRSAGAVLHMGCVNYPTEALQKTSGVLDMLDATFEVDVQKNRLKMGFRGSSAAWYDHDWLAFMRYGTDQLIKRDKEVFSYKVTERRFDTNFFDVVKTHDEVKIVKQTYRLPDVPMVRVQGYELFGRKTWRMDVGGRSSLRRKQYCFPASLWNDMLIQAEGDFERGALTFDKLYNYYRTTAPRNTINGLLMSGGQRVEVELLLPLVVHVGIVAAARVMLGQRETKAHLWDAMLSRVDVGLVRSMLDAAMSFVRSLGSALVAVPMVFVRWYTGLTDRALAESLVSSYEEPVVVKVPYSTVVEGCGLEAPPGYTAVSVFRQIALRDQPRDHVKALAEAPGLVEVMDALYDPYKDVPSDKWTTPPDSEDSDSDEDEQVGTEGATLVPSDIPLPESRATSDTSSERRIPWARKGKWVEMPTLHGDAEEPEVGSDWEETPDVDSVAEVPALAEARAAAILEAIEESELEERKMVELCSRVYSSAVDGTGKPQVRVLKNRAEEWDNADLWFVEGGRLMSSVLGREPKDCKASAAYVPTIPGFVSLARQRDRVEDGSDDAVVTVGHRIYGLVVVCDRLIVFNGERVRDAMRKALKLQLGKFEVTSSEGPPGCGKTRALMECMKEGDIVMCPVKESADDTRAKVQEDKPWFANPRHSVGTLDSYLVNYDTPAKAKLHGARLLGDEAYMTHSGKWYAAAALLGVRSVKVYGDQFQIPHIPRVQAPKVYLRIAAQEVENEWISYRNPHDTVAAYSHVYSYKVRSASTVKFSMRVVGDWRVLEVPPTLVVLVMYQEGKKSAREALGPLVDKKGVRIMSVHESEGKTFDHVWLFRFDARVRTDGMSLYDQQPHVLVAMSRHRKSFAYIRPRNLSDLVENWYARSQDPRAIAAAADVKSAGTPLQFL